MKSTILGFVAVYAVIVGATSCGGSGTTGAAPQSQGTTTYIQMERLARPAVKEAFQNFSAHDNTNTTPPYQTPLSGQSLYQAIGTFTATVAGRDATHQATLQAILIPDEIAADLSQNSTTADYLGVETAGYGGRGLYGGRALSDDVIDLSLEAIFGNLLTAAAGVPDDGHESPCLETDNINYSVATSHATTVFPYVGAPN
jgi:hypothetical protein